MHGVEHLAPTIVAALGALFGAIALALVPIVLLQRKEPASTIAWILTLVFLPALGAVLFLLFGRNRVRLGAKRKREADALVRSLVAAARTEGSSPNVSFALAPLSDLERQIFRVGAILSSTRPTGGNRLAFYDDGNQFYDALGAAIDHATHHVHVEFYLIRNDATGAWLRDKLAAAASRGVEVRLLCDGFGCLGLGRRWFRPLRRAGVKLGFFLPMRSMLLQPVNLRNHRKIVVVDGETAFTGGMNVGDEYRGTMRGVGAWRDLSFRIDGPAARALQGVFFQDWFFATGEPLRPDEYFPNIVEAAGGASVAIVPSGPDTRTEAIHRLFFAAIAAARERVFLTTPYFVPDPAMLIALEVAAMRGVEVHLILPSRSNHRVTFHAGRAMYDDLLEAGVHLHEFTPGMIHAKAMVVDGRISMIGSANMDMRSFRLNFEVHAFVHDPETASMLEERFRKDLAQTTPIALDAWRRRSWTLRVVEGAARLVSPLL
jgi:cardiolipin synthase